MENKKEQWRARVGWGGYFVDIRPKSLRGGVTLLTFAQNHITIFILFCIPYNGE